MNVRFNCSVVLSKKIRQLVGNKDASLTLIVQPIRDGKGKGTMSISVPDSVNIPEDFLNKETGIIITALDVAGIGPENSSAVGNLFSGVQLPTTLVESQPVDTAHVRTAVDKLAATEISQEMSESVVRHDEVGVPSEFSEMENPQCKAYVKDLRGLIECVNRAKNKQANIDPSKIVDVRQRALVEEEKEMLEAIDIDAYIVNRKCASLMINDLGISLNLNQPLNLTKISAKRIAKSHELLGLIKSGLVEIVSPDEAQKILEFGVQQSREMEEMTSADVFDSWEDAMDASDRRMGPVDRITITQDDEMTEEATLIAQTGVGTSLPSGSGGRGMTTRSFHGGSQSRMSGTGGLGVLDGLTLDTSLAQQTSGLVSLSGQRQVTTESTENSKGIKTIARARR